MTPSGAPIARTNRDRAAMERNVVPSVRTEDRPAAANCHSEDGVPDSLVGTPTLAFAKRHPAKWRVAAEDTPSRVTRKPAHP